MEQGLVLCPLFVCAPRSRNCGHPIMKIVKPYADVWRAQSLPLRNIFHYSIEGGRSLGSPDPALQRQELSSSSAFLSLWCFELTFQKLIPLQSYKIFLIFICLLTGNELCFKVLVSYYDSFDDEIKN